MPNKSHQLQIRVTAEQKAQLKALAKNAGVDVSSYVLTRALPPRGLRFQAILDSLMADESDRYHLAALNDFLSALAPDDFTEAVKGGDATGLSAFTANYVSAMVEHAATRAGLAPPAWTARVPTLEAPYFATPLKSLRPHLLRVAPLPFRRRNLFVDSSLGDRV